MPTEKFRCDPRTCLIQLAAGDTAATGGELEIE